MRTTIKRIIVIAVLGVVIYLVFARINPQGAEKIKDFFTNINIPRLQNTLQSPSSPEEKKQSETDGEQNDSQEETQEETQNNQADEGANDQVDNDDQLSLKDADEKVRTEPNEKPSSDTQTPNTAKKQGMTSQNNTNSSQSDQRLSVQEKQQIELLIYNIIKQ